jgi:hypothetical protein
LTLHGFLRTFTLIISSQITLPNVIVLLFSVVTQRKHTLLRFNITYMMKKTLFVALLSLFSYLGKSQTTSPIRIATDNYQMSINVAASTPQTITYRIDKNKNNDFSDDVVTNYSTPFSLDQLRLLAGIYNIEATATTAAGIQTKTTDKIDIIYPVLPSNIYAVVGTPFNLYFDNVLLTNTIAQYSFVVDGPSGGITSADKWSFMPNVGQNGTYDFKITVRNIITNRTVTTLSSKLHVAPANAGVGKSISTVLMGHSYITSYVIPPVFYTDFLSGANNPTVTQCGSRVDNFYQNIGVIRHEGQEATTWTTFYKPTLYPVNRANPFWDATINDVSMKAYVTRHCNNKTPDYFMVVMDLNDVCWLTYDGDMGKVETAIDETLANAEKFLKKIATDAPNMKIGVMMMPPFAKFLDNTRAYGYNTGNQVRQIQHRLIQKWMEKYDKASNSNLSIVPTHLELDRNTGYDPAAFARVGDFHPIREGYVQMCRSMYSWIKNSLAGTTNTPSVAQSPVTVEIKMTQPTCARPKGQLTALVAGGTPPYVYKWSTSETTQTIKDLISGTFTVTVTDANRNQQVQSASITQPAVPAIAISTRPQTVANPANGLAQLIITGGTAPYTTTWSNGASGLSLPNLVAGTYTVTVKDVNGCIAQKTATVANNIPTPIEPTNCRPMNISIAVINNECSNNIAKGAASVVKIVGGTAPYTAKWSNGKTGLTITDLASGAYSTTVTDKNGCSSQKTIVVSGAINVTYRTQNASSANTSDGSISAIITVGQPPYTIKWSNGATGVSLSGIAKGCYTATITDAVGCTIAKQVCLEANGTAIVAPPINPIIPTCTFNPYIYVRDAMCNKEASGLIEVFPPASGEPYTYNWSHSVTENKAKATNLKSGNYTVTITSSKNCVFSKMVTVNEPNAIEATPEIRNAANTIAQDGSVVVKVKGGVPPYFFSWSSGLPYQAASINVMTGIPIGSYFVVASDINGCRVTVPFTIQNTLLVGRSADAAQQKIILYPNPADAELEIENRDIKNPIKKIEIFTFEGMLQATFVKTNQDNPFHTSVDISELPEGWYFAQVRTQNTITVHKILVQRR